MPDQHTKIRKKLYAEVTARISFVTKGDTNAKRLVDNFLSRRGIVLVDEPTYESVDRWVQRFKVTFTVSYKVHGGWRSDFVKKIEQDSIDMKVEVEDLDIEVSRREIPEECPRKECPPCDFVKGIVRVPRVSEREGDVGSVDRGARQKYPTHEDDNTTPDYRPKRRFLGGMFR